MVSVIGNRWQEDATKLTTVTNVVSILENWNGRLKICRFSYLTVFILTASVVYWSKFLTTDPEAQVRSSAIPDFLRNSGFGTGSTQPCEYNAGAT
jgi:hypothetical protein